MTIHIIPVPLHDKAAIKKQHDPEYYPEKVPHPIMYAYKQILMHVCNTA